MRIGLRDAMARAAPEATQLQPICPNCGRPGDPARYRDGGVMYEHGYNDRCFLSKECVNCEDLSVRRIRKCWVQCQRR